jgi:hypothetical protein
MLIGNVMVCEPNFFSESQRVSWNVSLRNAKNCEFNDFWHMSLRNADLKCNGMRICFKQRIPAREPEDCESVKVKIPSV